MPSSKPFLAFAIAAGLAAQTPQTPPPPPASRQAPASPPVAIVVLTTQPRTLDPAALRQLVARVYKARLPEKPPQDGHGDWFEAGAGGAVLRIRGVLFRVTIGDHPFDVGNAGLAPDDPLAKPVRDHRGFVVLQAADDSVTGAAREAAYRTMGALAAALLGEDCVALFFGEFGALRAADAEAAADLVGADPMRAFAPVRTASILVLLKAPLQLDGERLRQAAKAAFGVEFEAPSPTPAANVAGVLGSDGLVRWGEVPIGLHAVDHKVLDRDALEGHGSAEVLQAVADHTAALQLSSVDRFVDEAQLRQRYVDMCHLLGALWGDDSLLLSFGCDRRPLLAAPDTAAKLRGPKPLAALGLEGN